MSKLTKTLCFLTLLLTPFYSFSNDSGMAINHLALCIFEKTKDDFIANFSRECELKIEFKEKLVAAKNECVSSTNFYSNSDFVQEDDKFNVTDFIAELTIQDLAEQIGQSFDCNAKGFTKYDIMTGQLTYSWHSELFKK